MLFIPKTWYRAGCMAGEWNVRIGQRHIVTGMAHAPVDTLQTQVRTLWGSVYKNAVREYQMLVFLVCMCTSSKACYTDGRGTLLTAYEGWVFLCVLCALQQNHIQTCTRGRMPKTTPRTGSMATSMSITTGWRYRNKVFVHCTTRHFVKYASYACLVDLQ